MSFITKMVCFPFISKWQPLDKFLLLLLFLLALSTMVFLHSPVFFFIPLRFDNIRGKSGNEFRRKWIQCGEYGYKEFEKIVWLAFSAFWHSVGRDLAELLQASQVESRSPGRYSGLRRAVSSPLPVGHLTVCKYRVEGSSGGGENINEAACSASAIDCGEAHA